MDGTPSAIIIIHPKADPLTPNPHPMTPPNEALHLVPNEQADTTVVPSAETRTVSLVRDQLDSTITPKKLDDQLAVLKEKLDQGEFDPLDAHDFLDNFDRFLSAPPYGGVGLDQMVISLYQALQELLNTALACNTMAQMTGQQVYLGKRVATLAEKVRFYSEKVGEEAERMHSF